MSFSDVCCSVCFESYDLAEHKPIILRSCPHTFCKSCVQQLLLNTPNRLKCPMCNTLSTARTVQDLNVNIDLMNLLDSFCNCASPSALNSNDKCSTCNKPIILKIDKQTIQQKYDTLNLKLENKRLFYSNKIEKLEAHFESMNKIMDKGADLREKFIENGFDSGEYQQLDEYLSETRTKLNKFSEIKEAMWREWSACVDLKKRLDAAGLSLQGLEQVKSEFAAVNNDSSFREVEEPVQTEDFVRAVDSFLSNELARRAELERRRKAEMEAIYLKGTITIS
jgi:hypothetical protein